MKHKDITDEMVRLVLPKMGILLDSISVHDLVSRYPRMEDDALIRAIEENKWKETTLSQVMTMDVLCELVIKHRIEYPTIIEDFGIFDFWRGAMDRIA